MCFAGTDGRKRTSRLLGGLLGICASVLVMSAPVPAQSSQRPLPVVSVSCDSDMDLCRALVQALAEIAPRRIYRINPDPMPPRSFDLRLDLSGDGAARLFWQTDGQGDAVPRTDLSDTDLARKLVAATPGLVQAMESLR